MKLRWLGLALIFCAVTGAAHAKQEQKPEFRFAAILSDNMVLQQQKKARIWGWARPGADIAVTITEDQAVAQPYLQQEEVTDKSEAYSVTVKYVEQNAPVFKALDRKIRQIQIDLPKLEEDLYGGNATKQAQSKLERIDTILDELQKDPWLSGRVRAPLCSLMAISVWSICLPPKRRPSAQL